MNRGQIRRGCERVGTRVRTMRRGPATVAVEGGDSLAGLPGTSILGGFARSLMRRVHVVDEAREVEAAHVLCRRRLIASGRFAPVASV
jgi:hypothetical protein